MPTAAQILDANAARRQIISFYTGRLPPDATTEQIARANAEMAGALRMYGLEPDPAQQVPKLQVVDQVAGRNRAERRAARRR